MQQWTAATRRLDVLAAVCLVVTTLASQLGCDGCDEDSSPEAKREAAGEPPDERRSSAGRPAQDAPACPGCNVILVSIDDLRADRLGCYGYERNTSPNIDRFAESAIVFSDVLAQYAWTRRSHRSLFTGKTYARIREDDPVLPELLKEAGLATAAFTGGGQLSAQFGFAAGFDTYREDGGLKARALEWLKENRDRQFFLFLHTYEVHCPFSPPEPFFSKFTSSYRPSFDLDGKCGHMGEVGDRPANPRDDFNNLPLSTEDFRYISAVYDGGVAYTDHLLAPFFQRFEDLGLMEDTLIVLLSDHGESLGEHGKIRHTWLKEPVLQVPLIVHVPGAPEGRVIDEPTQLVDVMPTVLAALGRPVPEGIDGVDLNRVIEGEHSFDGERVRISEGISGTTLSRTIRVDDRWKLVVSTESKERKLFDLRQGEDRDVIDEHPKVAESLGRLLERSTPETDRGETPKDRDIDGELRERLRALGYTPE